MRTATAAARALRRTPKASPSARFSTFRPSQNASNPIPNIPNNPAEAQKKAQETLNAAVSSAKSGFEKAQNSQAWKSAKDGLVKAKDSKVWEKAQSALGPVGQKAGQALGRALPFLSSCLLVHLYLHTARWNCRLQRAVSLQPHRCEGAVQAGLRR